MGVNSYMELKTKTYPIRQWGLQLRLREDRTEEEVRSKHGMLKRWVKRHADRHQMQIGTVLMALSRWPGDGVSLTWKAVIVTDLSVQLAWLIDTVKSDFIEIPIIEPLDLRVFAD